MRRTFRVVKWSCVTCGLTQGVWMWDTDQTVPACTGCHVSMAREAPVQAVAPLVIGDQCDVWIEHGICHADGTPRRYRSKAEMKRVAASRGLVLDVQHKPLPDTDKSPYTTKWF